MFSLFQNAASSSILITMIASLLAIILAFSMHEWAHAFVAVKNGDITPKLLGRYTLNPIKHIDPLGFICMLFLGFGWAKPVVINPNNFRSYRKGMFWTSIAGVLTNLIIAFVSSFCFFLCSKYLLDNGNWASSFITMFFLVSMTFNINLLIFNLLPIYPLDGFNVIMALSKNSSGYLKFNLQYGSLFLILFVVFFSGPLSMLSMYIIQGFTMLWGLFL